MNNHKFIDNKIKKMDILWVNSTGFTKGSIFIYEG